MTMAQSLAVGVVVGLVFGFVRLPAPSPPTVAGLLGVVGITLGWRLASVVLERM